MLNLLDTIALFLGKLQSVLGSSVFNLLLFVLGILVRHKIPLSFFSVLHRALYYFLCSSFCLSQQNKIIKVILAKLNQDNNRRRDLWIPIQALWLIYWTTCAKLLSLFAADSLFLKWRHIKSYLCVASVTVLVDLYLWRVFETQCSVTLQWSTWICWDMRVHSGELVLMWLCRSWWQIPLLSLSWEQGIWVPHWCVPAVTWCGVSCCIPQRGNSPRWASPITLAEADVLG